MGMAASQARLMSLTARLSDLEFRAQAVQNDKIRLADLGTVASQKYSKALDQQVMKVYSTQKSAYSMASINNLTSYTKALNLDGTNSKYRYMETSSGKLLATQDLVDAVHRPETAAEATANGHSTPQTVMKDKEDYINDYVKGSGTNGAFTDDDKKTQAYKYYSDVYDKMASNNYELISDKNANSAEFLTQQIELGNVYLAEYVSDAGTDGQGKFNEVSWDSGDATLDMDDDKTLYARAEAEYETTMASIEAKDKRFDLELTSINTEHSAIQTEIDSVKKVIDKNIERSFKTFNG